MKTTILIPTTLLAFSVAAVRAQSPSGKHLLTVAKITVKPDQREAFLSASNQLCTPSRAEKGCVSWEYFQDPADPNTFVFVEEWASKEAFDAHSHTEHFQKYPTPLRAHWLAKPFSTQHYTIKSSETATVTPAA